MSSRHEYDVGKSGSLVVFNRFPSVLYFIFVGHRRLADMRIKIKSIISPWPKVPEENIITATGAQ
jgi:hypothetical protein